MGGDQGGGAVLEGFLLSDLPADMITREAQPGRTAASCRRHGNVAAPCVEMNVEEGGEDLGRSPWLEQRLFKIALTSQR